MEIINIVLPVFLVIAIGYGLRLFRFLDDRGNQYLSRLVFHVAAPLLLFRSAALTPFQEAVNPEALFLMAGVTCLAGFLMYAAAAKMAPSRRGVLVQGTHRSNMIFVGLPIVANAYGHEVLGPAAVLIGFMVVVYNFLAILFLTLPHRNGSLKHKASWGRTCLEMIRNPLIIGSAAGILVSAFQIELPLIVDRSCELVGRIAMPLALLSVGASLDFRKLRAEAGPVMLVSLIKLVIYPGVICLGLYLLGYRGTELQVPVLIMATPTAVVSYIMAREMRGDERLAAAIVIQTTLVSLITISAWLAFFMLAFQPVN